MVLSKYPALTHRPMRGAPPASVQHSLAMYISNALQKPGPSALNDRSALADFSTSNSLANARQKFAQQHIDDAMAADGSLQQDTARRTGLRFADNDRLFTVTRPAHHVQYPIGLSAPDDGEEFALVGDVERIEA